MPRVLRILLISGAFLNAVACNTQQQPTYTPIAAVDDIMEGMVAPAADVVFESVYTEVSEAGIKDIVPQDDEEWGLVVHNAMTLVEAGNMMKHDPEYKGKADWEQLCQALMDSAMGVVNVAKAKNADEMLTAGGIMYEACTGCHKVYVPETPPEQQ